MKQAKELINFNAPSHIKQAFDSMCSAKGFTRTYALVHIMHKFIIEMQAELERQDLEILQAEKMIKERRKMMGFKEFVQSQKDEPSASEINLPIGFISHGNEEQTNF